MSSFKVVLNTVAIKELLKSEKVQGICETYGEQMKVAAGPGYEIEKRNYPERSGVSIYPGNDDAYYDNLANNTLEKIMRSVK